MHVEPDFFRSKVSNLIKNKYKEKFSRDGTLRL